MTASITHESSSPESKSCLFTIIGTRPEGTVVRVLSIENDWLHLANDGYILYGNGKWAEKID